MLFFGQVIDEYPKPPHTLSLPQALNKCNEFDAMPISIPGKDISLCIRAFREISLVYFLVYLKGPFYV
jgi:hypothetical protein